MESRVPVFEKLFRRGFACFSATDSLAEPEFLASWNRFRFGSWNLVVHPDVAVRVQQETEHGTSVSLGEIFVGHGTVPLSEHLTRVLRGEREPLEVLCGRFVLLNFTNDDVEVLHDPMGSQTVFYSGTHRVVSSHAALIAQLLDLPRSRQVQAFMKMKDQTAKTTRFLPGDLSLYDGVYLLLPNNELSVANGETARYWPARDIVPTTATAAINVWDEYFTNYANYLRPRHHVVMGLTGGVDSRAMIATFRSNSLPMRYETWDLMSEPERLRVAPMVEHLGGNHRWIERKSVVDSDEFRHAADASESAAGYTRGRSTLPGQVEVGSHPRDLFIYGHGGGVLAAPFSRKAKPWLPEDPLRLACRLHGGSGYKNSSREFQQFMTRAFAGYLERGNYQQDLHGADVGDLVYLENRMANWAALQIAVHVVGVNAHAGINSRRLFSTFWGLDGDARFTKATMVELMQRHDSVLASL